MTQKPSLTVFHYIKVKRNVPEILQRDNSGLSIEKLYSGNLVLCKFSILMRSYSWMSLHIHYLICISKDLNQGKCPLFQDHNKFIIGNRLREVTVT